MWNTEGSSEETAWIQLACLFPNLVALFGVSSPQSPGQTTVMWTTVKPQILIQPCSGSIWKLPRLPMARGWCTQQETVIHGWNLATSQTKDWPSSALQNRLTKTTAQHHDGVRVLEMKIFTHRLSQTQQCCYHASGMEGFDTESVRSELLRELGWGGLSDRTLSCWEYSCHFSTFPTPEWWNNSLFIPVCRVGEGRIPLLLNTTSH